MSDKVVQTSTIDAKRDKWLENYTKFAKLFLHLEGNIANHLALRFIVEKVKDVLDQREVLTQESFPEEFKGYFDKDKIKSCFIPMFTEDSMNKYFSIYQDAVEKVKKASGDSHIDIESLVESAAQIADHHLALRFIVKEVKGVLDGKGALTQEGFLAEFKGYFDKDKIKSCFIPMFTEDSMNKYFSIYQDAVEKVKKASGDSHIDIESLVESPAQEVLKESVDRDYLELAKLAAKDLADALLKQHDLVADTEDKIADLKGKVASKEAERTYTSVYLWGTTPQKKTEQINMMENKIRSLDSARNMLLAKMFSLAEGLQNLVIMLPEYQTLVNHYTQIGSGYSKDMFNDTFMNNSFGFLSNLSELGKAPQEWTEEAVKDYLTQVSSVAHSEKVATPSHR